MKDDELIVSSTKTRAWPTLEDGCTRWRNPLPIRNGGQARTFPESLAEGWDYAIKNQDGRQDRARDDASGAQTEGHQKR